MSAGRHFSENLFFEMSSSSNWGQPLIIPLISVESLAWVLLIFKTWSVLLGMANHVASTLEASVSNLLSDTFKKTQNYWIPKKKCLKSFTSDRGLKYTTYVEKFEWIDDCALFKGLEKECEPFWTNCTITEIDMFQFNMIHTLDIWSKKGDTLKDEWKNSIK